MGGVTSILDFFMSSKCSTHNLIFDLGNVLITFQPREFLQRLTENEKDRDAIYSLIFAGPEWKEMDRGNITVEEAKKRYMQRAPHHKERVEQFFRVWFDMFQPIEDTIALLQELRKTDIGLYGLSNYIRESYERISPRFPFLEWFDGIVFSFRLGKIKPEREIYEHLLETYRLKPEECLFIDDMEENVEGARAAGILAVRFESADRLRQELIARGVLSG